jgi:hypothetical protein
VRVYYIQSGYGTSEGDFTLEWEVLGSCPGLIDLAEQTSPFSGTTVGSSNFMQPSCSSYSMSGEVPFVYTLPPQSTIRLWQPSNGYDSVHELRYGGDCPGEFSVACTDDPDESMVEWTNWSDCPVRVYYIQSGWGTGEGDFTLEWEVTTADTIVKRKLLSTVHPRSMADTRKRMKSKLREVAAAQRISRSHNSDEGWGSGIQDFMISMTSFDFPPVMETCATDQMQATFVITTMTWAVETEWSLLSADGSTLVQKPEQRIALSWLSTDDQLSFIAMRYPDYFEERTTKCLDVGAAYELHCRDDFGDGWHGV